MASTEAASAIEPLAADQAEAAMALVAEAGWNQVAADWRLMLSAGHGCGMRDATGRWIGTGLVLPLGERIAWISMVLVAGEHRRRGLGGALLARCFEMAEHQGTIAGLDATELGRPVYLRFGFRDVYPLRRWLLDQPPGEAPAPPRGVKLKRAGVADLASIVHYDVPRSGLARQHILSHMIGRRPELATIAETAQGAIAGYALARDGRLATHIGPVVADSAATAITLIAAAMCACTPPFMLDVPEAHSDVAHWLEAQGATTPRTFMRMIRGAYPAIERPGAVFAVAGPELA